MFIQNTDTQRKRSTLSLHSLYGDLSADNAITVSSFPVTPCLSCDLIPVSIWLHARLSVCHARPYHCLHLTSYTSFLDLMHVMHDLTTVFIWLSCTSFCDLMSVMHDLTIVFIWLYARLSVTSCLSCTTLPLSSSDFMHVFLWPHVCHARPYHCLPLTSCTSFCDLMSVMHDLTTVSLWIHARLSVTLCPSPSDINYILSCPCVHLLQPHVCLTVSLIYVGPWPYTCLNGTLIYLFDRDLCYLFGWDLMFMFFASWSSSATAYVQASSPAIAQFSSVRLTMVSMPSEKSIRAPPRLSEVSPTLPLLLLWSDFIQAS